MPRVHRGVTKHKRHKKVLDAAAGYRGGRSRRFRLAKEQLLHSMSYSYRDRRDRKGTFRRLWIARINAGARANGISYSRLIEGLTKSGFELDRKMLSDLAATDEKAFASVCETAKQAINA